MTGVIIVEAVQTCEACPSQWDAWDADGYYWYLRYRHGRGAAERQPGPDPDTWASKDPELTFRGDEGAPGGWIDLEDFCRLAGLTLALGNAAAT
jgi:hypothetical protein